MEHFSAAPKSDIMSSTLSLQRHEVFHYFLSDDIKQDADTTIAHRKQLTSLNKNKKSIEKIIKYNMGKQ